MTSFEEGDRVVVINDIEADNDADSYKGLVGEIIDVRSVDETSFPYLVQFDNAYLGIDVFAAEELSRL